MFLNFIVFAWLRPHARNGYEALDMVIKGAAEGNYSYRQVTAGFGLFRLALFQTGCGLFDALVRKILLDSPWCCMLLSFIEGWGAGFLLYPILRPNSYGPWTGVFVVHNSDKWRSRAVLAAGVFIGFCGELHGFGARCTFAGWFAGLTTLSLLHRKWTFAAGSAFRCALLMATLLITMGLWREMMLIQLGFGAVQNRPDWGRRARLGLVLVEVVALAGLLILDFADTTDLINANDYLGECNLLT